MIVQASRLQVKRELQVKSGKFSKTIPGLLTELPKSPMIQWPSVLTEQRKGRKVSRKDWTQKKKYSESNH